MTHRVIALLLLTMLLLPQLSNAQDNWTCDSGPTDVLDAAQAAYNKGDLTRASELIQIAAQVCKTNPLRAGQTSILQTQITRSQRPTATPDQASADRQHLSDLIDQSNTAHKAGQLAQALSISQEALPLARQLGDRVSEAAILNNIGLILMDQGQYTQALTNFQQMLTIARDIGNRAAEGSALNNLGSVYEAQSQYTQALDYYKQALAIAQAIGDRSAEGSRLSNVGTIYDDQGQYTEALDYYDQALAIAQKIGDRLSEETALNNIAGINQVEGQYDKALANYQKAFAIMQEIGDQVGMGIALSNIAGVYDGKGNYTDALNTYKRALAIVRAIGNRASEGILLGHIGGVYEEQGQYAQALDYEGQALAIERSVGDRNSEGTSLGDIATIYSDQGQYAQALDTYSQGLAIERAVGDRQGEGRTLSNIGLVYEAQGQYAQALDYFSQGVAIERTIGDRHGESQSLHYIGGVYSDQGQYAQALDYNTQALVIARAIGDQSGEGQDLGNIGAVYDEQGQYAQALDYDTQALAIQRAIGNRPSEEAALSNIGAVYEAQGQYAQALDTYTQALAIQQAIGDQPAEGTTLANIGTIYYVQGQYAQALDYDTQAFNIQRLIGDQAGEGATLVYRGLAREYLGQLAEAVKDYKDSVIAIESILNAARLDSAIASLSGQVQNVLPFQRLAVLLALSGIPGDLEKAFQYTELGHAILIRTQLTTKPINFRADLDQSLLDDETRLRLSLNNAQKVLDTLHKDSAASATDIQQAQATLDKAQTDYQHQLETMQLRGGFRARQISHQVATLSQIQAVLPADTTLVVYAISSPDSIAFLITNSTLTATAITVTSEQIAEQVKAFDSDRQAHTDALSALYKLVITPIADKLTTKHLIIVPDGALNYVPFAALQSPSGRYLIDDYAVSMIPSATTLVLLNDRYNQNPTKPTSPGLVLEQPSAPGLPTLNNARAEASAIAQVLGVQPILNATEADLRNKVKGSQVLTISAHAELNPTAPLFSSIDLKGDSQSSGRFEARSIYELDLSATDLVVLSGCNTASGGDGEDFGVLTRAFFGAGASHVVASLWSVDDAATAFLITSYMSARATSVNEADALRTAMLATRAKYPEPYFWASFVLTGLPTAANQKGSPSGNTAAPTLDVTAQATATPKSTNNQSVGASVSPRKK